MISNEDDLAEEPVDECDNCHAPIDGEHAATSDVCHDCWCATQLRANSAEQELRETAGELEKGARLLKNRISQCNELQTRLTEATALLKRVRDYPSEPRSMSDSTRLESDIDALLSRAPAQPAMCRVDVGGEPCGEPEPCAEHPEQPAARAPSWPGRRRRGAVWSTIQRRG